MRSRFCERQQSGARGYGYSDRNSKFSNGNAYVLPSQNVQHMRKTLNSVETAPICPKTDVLYTYKTVLQGTRRNKAYDRDKTLLIDENT
ncbi:hypothetical protein TNCV_1929031 [Trichonephila clavipes]|nr:hypothetical protein TNCV_1929031 [Trichonephila clavipes]